MTWLRQSHFGINEVLFLFLYVIWVNLAFTSYWEKWQNVNVKVLVCSLVCPHTGGREIFPSITDTCSLSDGLCYLFAPSPHIPAHSFFFVFLTCKYLSSLSKSCIFDGKEYLKLHLWCWNVSRPVTSKNSDSDLHQSLAFTFNTGATTEIWIQWNPISSSSWYKAILFSLTPQRTCF